MTKRQKRGNREIKKPKLEKAQPKPENRFAIQAKMAANTNAPRGKGKT